MTWGLVWNQTLTPHRSPCNVIQSFVASPYSWAKCRMPGNDLNMWSQFPSYLTWTLKLQTAKSWNQSVHCLSNRTLDTSQHHGSTQCILYEWGTIARNIQDKKVITIFFVVVVVVVGHVQGLWCRERHSEVQISRDTFGQFLEYIQSGRGKHSPHAKIHQSVP